MSATTGSSGTPAFAAARSTASFVAPAPTLRPTPVNQAGSRNQLEASLSTSRAKAAAGWSEAHFSYSSGLLKSPIWSLTLWASSISSMPGTSGEMRPFPSPTVAESAPLPKAPAVLSASPAAFAASLNAVNPMRCGVCAILMAAATGGRMTPAIACSAAARASGLCAGSCRANGSLPRKPDCNSVCDM